MFSEYNILLKRFFDFLYRLPVITAIISILLSIFVLNFFYSMNRFRILYKYIYHFLSARNTQGFGVHSPFVFQFTRYVLCEKKPYYIFPSIEKLRSELRSDKRLLNIKDFGTANDRDSTVANIACHSLKSAKYGQLLFRIAHYIKACSVLELGTSLGITTSYLASSSSKIKCLTLEGCPQIAKIASENFHKLNLENIKVLVGDIDTTLTEALKETEQLDLIFFDANHQSKAVLSYFELCLPKIHKDTILVIDDIYWSADMEEAWKKVKNHPQVISTIDLFQIGIVFFNTDLSKSHYKMRF